ncbi:hypothetical protein GCM10022284_74370 [Streptomyces hundungensis]
MLSSGTALLVVSELLTDACKYATGSCLLELLVAEGTVWANRRPASTDQPTGTACAGRRDAQ